MSGNGVDKIQVTTQTTTGAAATAVATATPKETSAEELRKYFAELQAKKAGAKPAPQPAPQAPAEEKSFLDKAIDFAKTPLGKVAIGAAVLLTGGLALKAAGVFGAAKGVAAAATAARGLSAGKTLAMAATVPLASALASCSSDDPLGLGEDVDLDISHEHLIKPRIITNTIEVPKYIHDTTYVDKPYPVHDTIYVDKPIQLPGDTVYVKLPGDTIYVKGDPYPVYVTDTLYVKEPSDTIKIEVPVIQRDTVYQDVIIRDTVTMKPNWHSPVNPLIDLAAEQFGVQQDGQGEFTLSFAAYDEHNSRLINYVLDPQASAQDGSNLRYKTTITNWDEEAGTITPGKNEEKGTADVSISQTGQGLNIVRKSNNSIESMDLEPEGNLYLVKNKSGQINSPWEPTPLLQEGGFLQRGDFENSIKWTWPGEGVFGHFTNAKRTKSDAPVFGE